jgi:hypothetical protein
MIMFYICDKNKIKLIYWEIFPYMHFHLILRSANFENFEFAPIQFVRQIKILM